MNLIPASWKILWDVWQVQILVLLSLTLQIILFVFGKRRKNISSQWINVIVWLAYTMADWVATVALGKLSHTLNNVPNPNNTLQALWAPLLLLHLGGPDTITAYSLNDNQLWIRHFLGMSVQATVAIYVIVMSWRHFWFSFMLIPAFVAGIIKYGERTWALKLACHDESKNIVPFYDLRGHDLARFAGEHENDLIMAHNLVMDFKDYIENYDIRRSSFKLRYAKPKFPDAINLDVHTDCKNVLEVEMGLMYDLLYTKAPITFTKRGCIFRSISFMCTVSVLVGLFRLIAKWHKQHYSMVDIVITGVLLVGALALEIYAVILLLFSDWAMLWLIKRGRGKWANRLWQKFPWFFEKKWSKKMGQIDLFEEEDKRSKWSKILKSLGIQGKFYWGSCTTSVCIPPTLYPMIVEFIRRDAATDNLNFGWLDGFIGSTPFHELIFFMHIMTYLCCRYDDINTSQNSANSSGRHDNKETCKTLSHYMVYLLLTCRSLLPVVVSDSQLIFVMDNVKLFSRNTGGRMSPMENGEGRKSPMENGERRKMKKFIETYLLLSRIFSELIREGNEERWEKLKNVWLAMLCYAAISGPKNYHLQQLREGGELLNLVWFLIPQSYAFYGVDTSALNSFFNKCFQP